MSELQGKYNEIISALVADGVLTPEKVQYAERVLSKLKGDYRLLDVLKKLQYIKDDDIWNAVQKKRVSTRLGNLLIELGYISQQQLESAIEVQKKEREAKSSATLVSGLENVSDAEFARSKALELGYQYLEPDFEAISPELITKCRPEWYEAHKFFPVGVENSVVTVGFSDPSESNSLDAAREFFGEDLAPVIIRSELLLNFISRYKSFIQSGTIFTGSGSVGKGVFQSIVSAAIEKPGVTDIFVEPMRDRLVIKFRHNCLTKKHQEFPPQIKASLFNYIKESCIDESEPLGNRIGNEFHHEKGIFFLSGRIVHTRFGDSATISIKRLESDPPDLPDLPISKYVVDRIKNEVVENDQGLFLITGGDNSAKNIVQYSILKKKKKVMPDSRIVVLGENITFGMDDLMYVQSGKESFEYQINRISDLVPDLVSVTGISTSNECLALLESASKGIQSLATMRAASTTDALAPFFGAGAGALLASLLSGVLHQKVMRRICPICVTPLSLQVDLVRKIGINPNDLAGLKPMKGVGCKSCGHTGYNGLIIVTEFMSPDERVKDALCEVRSSYQLKRYMAATTGFINLVEDAILWAGDGQTTIEEIARVFPKNQKIRAFADLQKIRGY